MVHEVSNIERRPQDNKDANSAWAKCRYCWVTQLLVRFGLKPDLTDFLNKDGAVPDCFNYKKLKPLNVEGISWWNKVHKERSIGNFCEGSTAQTRFPRDENGNYKADGGKYCEEKKALTVKFPKQGHFCFGVAMVAHGNGAVGE